MREFITRTVRGPRTRAQYLSIIEELSGNIKPLTKEEALDKILDLMTIHFKDDKDALLTVVLKKLND